MACGQITFTLEEAKCMCYASQITNIYNIALCEHGLIYLVDYAVEKPRHNIAINAER